MIFLSVLFVAALVALNAVLYESNGHQLHLFAAVFGGLLFVWFVCGSRQ